MKALRYAAPEKTFWRGATDWNIVSASSRFRELVTTWYNIDHVCTWKCICYVQRVRMLLHTLMRHLAGCQLGRIRYYHSELSSSHMTFVDMVHVKRHSVITI